MPEMITPLNFSWKYKEEFANESLNASFDDKDYIEVDIPHANKEIPFNDFDEKMFQFVSSYRKHFEYKKQKGNRVILHFEGVASYAKVALNSVVLGEHKCGYTAFEFDVTECIADGENVLSVMVDSTERADIPPFGNVVDYLCYGGIYREVWLEEVPEEYIKDVFVKPKDVLTNDKYIEADITFNKQVKGEMTIELLDGENVIKGQKCSVQGEKYTVRWKVGRVVLWSLDNPKLYSLKISFGSHEKSVRFGFRECVFTKNGFFLNGEMVKIRGLNRHQSYPYVGYAMPASAQRADADFLKTVLGVNFVRTSHYPDSVHFLNRCDEIGLLVFTEIPSWQHIGDENWKLQCIKNTEDMILRDRNHPSVVLWGVRVNESQDCDDLYIRTNKIAKETDPTRQTGGVRAFPRSHFFEDVYTYNDFIHSGKKTILLNPSAVAGNKPYLVTEHNGHMFPTKSYDREEIRVEHALRHARVLNKAYSNDRWCGAVGWCMSDYNTHKDFGSGDKICYHGVADMFRIPKLAGWFYASQQDEIPVLEISSSMDIGEHPACKMGQIYAFTNCDYVKVYKNGKYVSSAYPDKKKFGNLPHPPVFIRDFVGDALVKEENIPEFSSNLIKPVIAAAGREAWQFSPLYYVPCAVGVITSGKKISDMIPLVNKYVSNWGGSVNEYKFEGIKNGRVVKTVIRTACKQVTVKATADSLRLKEKDTYDVTRIVLEAVDQNGNRMPFAFNGVKVTCTGSVKLIGPENFSLMGGVRGFWVRTNGKSGKGKVKIVTESMGEVTLTIEVEKE